MKATIAKGFRSVLEGRGGFAATTQTFVVKIIILAINLGTGIIAARFLGPAGRGELTAMLLWPQLLAFTMTLGLPKSLLYNLKKQPAERSRFFSTALLMSLVLGSLASIIGIVFMPYWLSQYSLVVVRQSQWLMLTAPLALLGTIYISAFEAEEDFSTANQFRYWMPFITLIVLGFLLLTQSATVFNIALAYLIPGIPINLWMLVKLWQRYQPTWHGLWNPFRKLIDFGLRCYGIDLINGLSFQIAQALVVGLLSPAAMGLYTVALSMTRMLTMFEDSVAVVLLPKAIALSRDEIITLTGRAARLTGLLTIVCAVFLMFAGPVLLGLLYGSEFLGSVPAFRILLIEIVIHSIIGVLAQAFMAIGQPGIVTLLQGVGLGFTVPLMLVLIPKYGIFGASLALLGSTIVRLFFALVSFPLFLKVQAPSLIVTKEDVSFVKQALQLKK